ncbi:TetR/AcrR family transcriptional regulator [Flavisphingomonas formosensis]|uniref:TetR/AcrR family transcriptional regulator n=1 Tax=Flavisphingomonas formosensis TaxID=861534 RepID=UPI0012FCAEDA|nr:TetR/AcrR family transcriptional regulator [Sphingomonas formosensis]
MALSAAAAGEQAAVRPRAGRPPDPERGDAILAVTLDILAERGFAGLTVGEIVARAHVSKATLYRRWPTKEELVMAAFDRLPRLVLADRGDLIEELLDLFGQYARLLHATPLASVLPGLVAESARNPALAAKLAATVAERRRPGREALARAVVRGELPPGLDLDQANEIVMALLVQRSFLDRERLSAGQFRPLLEIVVAGLRAGAS